MQTMDEERLARVEAKLDFLIAFLRRLEPLVKYAESNLPRRVPRQGGPR